LSVSENPCRDFDGFPTILSDSIRGMELAVCPASPRQLSDMEGCMQIGVETSRAVANKRIFVVDADEITRAVLQFMLQDENETHDLADLAAAQAKARDWPPNLLLLGLSLVIADPEILTEIQSTMPSARVMLVAEAGQDAQAQIYVGRGADAVLTKPLRVESVRRKVDGLLGLLKQPIVKLSLSVIG
jgi:CheY-like chemotaxis protein